MAKRKLPASAFRMSAAMEFAEEAPADGKVSVTLLARSPAPISHGSWGKIAHDMTGMILRKDACPLDYAHNGRYDPDTILGYADEFEASPKNGLLVKGFLVSTDPNDLAAKVIAKGAAGVPFEASIDWNGPGAIIEEIGDGVTVQVNGYDFEGPGYVVRQWPLRSIAVCPYGADHNTRTQFSERPDEEIEVEIKECSTMFKKPDAKPDDKQHTETPAASPPNATPPVDHRAEFTAELKRFTDRFGAVNGAKWLSEGKSFSDALELHAKDLESQLAAAKVHSDGLAQRIEQAKPGEDKPVTFSDGEQKPGQPKPEDVAEFSQLGPNLAKVAAAIKLPGKK